ncbi:ABC transporter substrate-binding protein [Aquabacterium sp. OR-4]|uniref:ABC transporter substrate-binding protein n=1 Tax=Aquabacterium sp. OR-4 TaxID=2978127 RepID=UPI0021B38A7A|nr:extracellular solute-binding protein [Aquabacterium sp. OR-4]MDT7838134.1 extracellular solute-binding protein [Aquabacterium sp. OR-4]
MLSRRGLLAAGAGGAATLSVWPAAVTASEGRAPREVLTIAAFPLIDEIGRAALSRWRTLHPEVALRILTRQYIDHHTAMTTALSTARGLPDVMALEASFVGRYARGTGLLDLRQPPFGIEQLRDRVVPYAYQQAVTATGAVVAMPTDIGPGTMLWRTDILGRAGLDGNAIGRSWDDYLAAGRQIKARTGAFLVAAAQEIKDIALRDGRQPGEGLYYDADSRALADTPRFERAFEIALRARQAGLDARLTAWTNEWAEGYKRGKLATALSGAWLVGQLATWVAPETRGLWRAAQLPGPTYAAYGGTFYALPRQADARRRALAWDYIRLMTLDTGQQLAAFKQQDAFPALREVHQDAFFDGPVAFLGDQPARRLWREAAARIDAMPVHRQNAFADEVVNTELDNVLTRAKPIRSALADAQRLLQRRALR